MTKKKGEREREARNEREKERERKWKEMEEFLEAKGEKRTAFVNGLEDAGQEG